MSADVMSADVDGRSSFVIGVFFKSGIKILDRSKVEYAANGNLDQVSATGKMSFWSSVNSASKDPFVI